MAIAFYVLGSIGYSGTNCFYDALLVDVAPEDQMGRVSSLGFALGYLGGGLLFAINVLMTIKPHWFGLQDRSEAVRWSFFSVAIWWAVFTVPLALWVRQKHQAARQAVGLWRSSWRQLRQTFAELRFHRQVLWFLLAYFFYIDGVNTVIKMAADYAVKVGLPTDVLIGAGLMTQFVGFPAAIVYSRLGHRFGEYRAILAGIGVYILIIFLALRLEHAWEFYVLAALIGLVQGGVQALSRSLYASLIPVEKAGEFFGFFNMLGRFSTMIGPILVGFVSVQTGSARLSILSLLILFAIGGGLLWFRPPQPRT